MPFKLKQHSSFSQRVDFGIIKSDLAIPFLIDDQLKNYDLFLSHGLKETVDSFFPLFSQDSKKKLTIDKVWFEPPTITEKEAKYNLTTYNTNVFAELILTYVDKDLIPFVVGKSVIESLNVWLITKIGFIEPVETTNQLAKNVFSFEEASFTNAKDFSFNTVEKRKIINKDFSKTIMVEILKTNDLDFAVKFVINTINIVFLTELPLITKTGNFIINGHEKVVILQLIRAPGAYYKINLDKTALNNNYFVDLIPTFGTWLSFEAFSKVIKQKKVISTIKLLQLRIEKTKKAHLSTFLTALGVPKEEMLAFCPNEYLINTYESDVINDQKKALEYIFQKLRKGESGNFETIKNTVFSQFFSKNYYFLSEVGRYKLNKKLCVTDRIINRIVAETITDESGKVIITKNTFIKHSDVLALDVAFAQKLSCTKTITHDAQIVGNNLVHVVKVYLDNDKQTDIEHVVAVLNDCPEQHLTIADFIASISYLINLTSGIGIEDDIDSLINRRVRTVNELIQNQVRVGLTRIIKQIREKINVIEPVTKPSIIYNHKPLTNAINEFFNLSQLVQFLDQTNFLAELSHKRRITTLGPGGLSRDSVGSDIRDIHHSYYGRLCPIETPEGPNIGLINSLAIYAIINKYGFIEAPFRKIVNGYLTDEINYLSAIDEYFYVIGQSTDFKIDQAYKNINPDDMVLARFTGKNVYLKNKEVNYIDVSPKQIVSLATSCIPFLENDDGNRALMGANMQRQSVPLLNPSSPLVGTGVEHKIALDSGTALLCTASGTVVYVDSEHIQVQRASQTTTYQLVNEKILYKAFVTEGLTVTKGQVIATFVSKTKQTFSLMANEAGKVMTINKHVIIIDEQVIDNYQLTIFERSNQSTILWHNALVNMGEKVQQGQILADGSSMENGELALGKNVVVAFTTWRGYNYEDAFLISEQLFKDDVFTSIRLEEYTVEVRQNKLGKEIITRDIPNLSTSAQKYLDDEGIVMIGAEVREGDILVGKITPKNVQLTPEDRLLQAIFGEKSKNVKDTSLRLPNGEFGIVHSVKRLSSTNNLNPSFDVLEIIKVYVIQKRKIKEGDKMAGRHGNKGVVSKILPIEDMPFLEDGTPVDILINPLSIPSRMNIGQILESLLGLVAKKTNQKFTVPVFEGINDLEFKKLLASANIHNFGKTDLFDGITGEKFCKQIFVGVMYMIKLSHMVDDKIHARNVGTYSLITQQPLGGKSQNGGQRLGEMEVWALEAYGAAHTLRELLTLKSDDIKGRIRTYDAIINNRPIPEPGIPESFNVLTKELRGLCLNISLKKQELLDDNLHYKKQHAFPFDKLQELNVDYNNPPEDEYQYNSIKNLDFYDINESSLTDQVVEPASHETSLADETGFFKNK